MTILASATMTTMILVKSKMLQSMKKIFSNVMLVAAAAMTFFACQKPEVIEPETSQGVNGLVFTSEKPSFDDETKTEWTGSNIQWSKGDKIRVAYTCDGVWQNADGSATADEESGSKSAKIYESAGVTEAGVTANFSVPGNFKGAADGVYEFYGIYPSSSVGSADIKYAPSVTVDVPTGQKSKAKSFDASADLMASKSVEYVGMPTDKSISLKWNRLVAHANLTLKALPINEGEVLSSIKLTANEGADMVGTYYLYLDTFNVVKPNSNSSSNVLVIDASDLSFDADNNVEFWACFLPCTWTSIKIDVETDKASYTRDIDLSTNQKTFAKNARNVLAVNMASAIRNEKSSTETATLTFDDTAKRTTYSTSQQVWEENGVTVTNDKGSSTSNVGDYAKPARFYKNSTITIDAPGNILSIEFACNTEAYATSLQKSISGSIVNSKTVTVNLDGTCASVTYTLSDGQVRMDALTVEYVAGVDTPEEPDTTPSVKLEVEELELTADATEGTVNVEAKNISSIEVRALAEEGAQDESDWLVAEYDEANSCVTYDAPANDSEEARTAYIEVYCLDTEGNVIIAGVKVIQNGVETGGAVEPETATLSFADKAQRTTFTTSQQIWEQNGIKLTNNKASSTNAVADYANPARFYAGSNLELTAPGAITMLVFDANSATYATAMKNSIGTVSGATVSVSSDKVTVTFSTPVASFTVAKFTAQVRMDSITVTYIPEN